MNTDTNVVLAWALIFLVLLIVFVAVGQVTEYLCRKFYGWWEGR